MPTAQSYLSMVSKHFMVVVPLFAILQDCNAGEHLWGSYRVGTVLSVKLTNGRVVHGAVDANTTNDQLHLVLEEAGTRVCSILNSGDIQRIQLEHPRETRTQEYDRVSAPAVRPRPIQENATSPSGTPASSLAAFAHVDNWNGDPKSDGLRIFLRPTGANGELVQATGTVSIQLYVYRGDVRNTAGRLHEEESWSYELTESDYHRSGATITLPFRKIQPENDHEVYSLGTLNVRLKIAGQGVLDATLDDVVLRKNSITSDLRKRR